MRYFVIAAAFAIAALVVGPGNAAEQVKSDGKCWVNNNNTHFEWGKCNKEAKAKEGKAKKGKA
jgi:hypothetical protein